MLLTSSRITAAALAAMFLFAGTLHAAEEENPEALLAESMAAHKDLVTPFLAQHCNSCHGKDDPEGELNLVSLAPDMEGTTSAARWAVVLVKLKKGEMPPEGEPQPKAESVKKVIDWIMAEMKRAGKHVAHREEYLNGNKVPHEILFDPKSEAKIDVPGRIRLVSPQIYAEFAGDVGKRARGIGQPVTPSQNTTFKDMGAQKVDEPVTVLLIRNALAIVKSQTRFKIEKGQIVRDGWSDKDLLRLLDDKNPPSEEELKDAFHRWFDKVLQRSPTEDELKRLIALYQKNVKEAGRVIGARYTLAAVLLFPEAIYRWESGSSTPDERGLVRLAPREIAFALAYALGDKRPDGWLLKLADEGKLDTREGVADAVRQMLDHPKMDRPRIMRFFREYFGYTKATEVFKDSKEHPEHDSRILVEDTDRLIEYILEKDKNVLYELLTTNLAFVAYKKADEIKKKRADRLAKFLADKKKNPEKYKNKTYKPPGKSIYEAYNLENFPDNQPTKLPENERAGILTQPAWLVAYSKSDENDVIHRGKWIRERLLGGVVPDIPITVDAQLPNAPEKTLRERVAVTKQDYCWKCHRLMNDLGLPFEQYSHTGHYREKERVLDPEATAKNINTKGQSEGPVYREVAVDATGGIEHSGDDSLQGDVKTPVELIKKLAKSDRVEQVFIRHAFRFWMGRNETPGDGASLREVQKAYRDSGGSFKELLVAMLSSDSFLYRVPNVATADATEK